MEEAQMLSSSCAAPKTHKQQARPVSGAVDTPSTTLLEANDCTAALAAVPQCFSQREFLKHFWGADDWTLTHQPVFSTNINRPQQFFDGSKGTTRVYQQEHAKGRN